MKVYTKIVFSMATGEVIEEESFEYVGPVAECKGGSSTTTTSTPPWQQPYLQDVFQGASYLKNYPMQYYPGQTVAGFTPAQQLAQTATANRAIMGNPLLGASQEELGRTLRGDYLDPSSNPWLAETYALSAGDVTRKFAEATMPEIRRTAMGTGAYGGSRQGVAEGTAMRGLTEELSNLATKIYAPAYETERGRQFQAMGLGPQFAEADYADIGKLAAVGEEQQSMEQALLDQAIKAWEFYQLEPWQRMGMYSNLITGDVGGTTTSMTRGK